MFKHSQRIISLFVVLAFFVAPMPVAAKVVSVSRVIDGDTFVTKTGERVRLIGIDAPELKGSKCYSGEAKSHLAALISGKKVDLKYDKDKKDKYGRTLAYVYTSVFVNQDLARNGYAAPMFFAPNTAKESTLLAATQQAQKEKRGIWKNCDASKKTYAPQAVSSIKVVNLSEKSSKVSWKKGKYATNYTIDYRKKGSSSWKTIKNIKTTQYTLKSLEAGKKYEYRISSNNGLGASKKASVKTFTVISSNTAPVEDEQPTEEVQGQVTVSISDAAPTQNSTVTVSVTLLDQSGNPIQGATGSAVAHYKSTNTTRYFAATNPSGQSSVQFQIGRSTVGYRVTINVTMTYNGKTYTGVTSFVPVN